MACLSCTTAKKCLIHLLVIPADAVESIERSSCVACLTGTLHDAATWANHPNRGHGFNGQAWTK